MPGETDRMTWGKERRDCMKEAFSTLEKLLPSYDPSTVLTRINILNESIEYIQDMQDRVDGLLKPNSKTITEVINFPSVESSATNFKGIEDSKKTLLDKTAKFPTLGTNILANSVFHPASLQSQHVLSTQMILHVANDSNKKLTETHPIQSQKISGDETTLSKNVMKCDINNAVCSREDNSITLNSTDIPTGFSTISNSNIQSNETVINNLSFTDRVSTKDVILFENIPQITSKCSTETSRLNEVPIPAPTSNTCTSILIPNISKLTAMKKTTKARRKVNRRSSRPTLRKLKKVAHKRKMKV